ncbi:hypothetical protein L1049_011613 [Liquidambar formosana]|uniref:Myb/SANT-like domain-containing protein n=1 Tax=Liquidambar formosana TaxID=63359 RepID=A0AAP0RRS2_LIQFO
MMTADDKAHPDAKKMRTSTMPNYYDLHAIDANSTATEKNSCCGKDVGTNDIAQGGLDSQTPSTVRTDWTPPMDQYFLDLMLDQARKGQKSEKTFTKYAWARMTTSFNKKHRTSTMPNYYDLHEIFANSTATGKYSSCGKDVETNDTARTLGPSSIDVTNEDVIGGSEEDSQSEDDVEPCNQKALDVVLDVEEGLYMDACDLLEDGGKAKIFVSLDISKRKTWLLRKLRPNDHK